MGSQDSICIGPAREQRPGPAKAQETFMGAILSIGSILPIGLVISGTREKWPLLKSTRLALMGRRGQQMPWTGSRSNAADLGSTSSVVVKSM